MLSTGTKDPSNINDKSMSNDSQMMNQQLSLHEQPSMPFLRPLYAENNDSRPSPDMS